MKKYPIYFSLAIAALGFGCTNQASKEAAAQVQEETSPASLTVTEWDSSLAFTAKVAETGRYRISVKGAAGDSASVWIEDYIKNRDGRQYNITGTIDLDKEGKGVVDGSPLAKGDHAMRLHTKGTDLKEVKFELIQNLRETSDTIISSMEGENWKLKWADEFNGSGLVDTNKWTYNLGNWGWGNNELQYYTLVDTQNARQENGNLIIEAHPVENSEAWTSARLTTQAKVSFLYGRIEFRAKVPNGLGTWAAGWLLGDEYRDELSWPYCGEIDVLECVGYEIDSLGNGENHASCHTPAYYFKKDNHITGEIELDSMHNKFHTYAIEWYPDRIEAYLDEEHYYTYDKIANELEWPFAKPQNIIINLAIGGGWGGARGVDQEMGPQQYILDYIRVYEKK